MGCTSPTISTSQYVSRSAGTYGESKFDLIIHIFRHSKEAQAESLMKPFCVLPLNKYVNYWAQHLPQNMPLLWMSSWICAAFPPQKKQASPPTFGGGGLESNTWLRLWCALTKPWLRVLSEPRRFPQLSVSVVKLFLCTRSQWRAVLKPGRWWRTHPHACRQMCLKTSGGAFFRLFL